MSRFVRKADPRRVKLRQRRAGLLDIHVVVEQGADLVKVGSQIQRDVAKAVDKMVGLPVAEINVFVQDME